VTSSFAPLAMQAYADTANSIEASACRNEIAAGLR